MPLVRIKPAGAGRVVARVPAKVNVALAVLGRRADGYHEIDTIMLPVTLEDRLEARRTAGETVTLRVRGGRGVPSDGTNTVLRAAAALRDDTGEGCGAALTLVKRIPAGAGLGGGSADAAAALAALDRLWGCRTPPRTLRTLAAGVGSDVPFFLGDGPARARGRGEIVRPVRCRGIFHLVLVHPGIALATRDVYENLKFRLTGRNPGATMRPIMGALRKGDAAALGAHVRNDLEASAVSLCPRLRALRTALLRYPFLGVGMSGSGSTYFGVCRDRTAARGLAASIAGAGLGRAWAVEAG